MVAPVIVVPALFDGIARSSWAYPALEVVHIVGIAILLGNLVLLEARVWGMGLTLSVQALARLALPLALLGFGLIVLSGSLMFASNAVEFLGNRLFLFKLGLISLAGLNAAAFHARDGLGRLDGWARLQTAVSLGLWLGVIICGRFIAYR